MRSSGKLIPKPIVSPLAAAATQRRSLSAVLLDAVGAGLGLAWAEPLAGFLVTLATLRIAWRSGGSS